MTACASVLGLTLRGKNPYCACPQNARQVWQRSVYRQRGGIEGDPPDGQLNGPLPSGFVSRLASLLREFRRIPYFLPSGKYNKKSSTADNTAETAISEGTSGTLHG